MNLQWRVEKLINHYFVRCCFTTLVCIFNQILQMFLHLKYINLNLICQFWGDFSIFRSLDHFPSFINNNKKPSKTKNNELIKSCGNKKIIFYIFRQLYSFFIRRIINSLLIISLAFALSLCLLTFIDFFLTCFLFSTFSSLSLTRWQMEKVKLCHWWTLFTFAFIHCIHLNFSSSCCSSIFRFGRTLQLNKKKKTLLFGDYPEKH